MFRHKDIVFRPFDEMLHHLVDDFCYLDDDFRSFYKMLRQYNEKLRRCDEVFRLSMNPGVDGQE